MKYAGNARNALDQVQVRAACKLAEIHQLLAPGLVPPFTPEELQRMAEGHLAELSAEEGEVLRGKALVAYCELERLMAELSRYLVDIGDELHKVSHHSRGITAYSKTARNGLRPAFGL